MKRLAILGCTGSIGVNCLKVVASQPDLFQVVFLATYKNVATLFEQARVYHPEAVVIASGIISEDWLSRFSRLGVSVLSGAAALSQIASEPGYDLLVNAIVGAAGFLPTLRALENRKSIALANKETLVMGGSVVTALANKNSVAMIPIDSEHSAIFQCLMGEDHQAVQKIILTASGGPFRTWSAERFARVSVTDALSHPNWKMGAKITVDSATMMNKGLEVIEACWLFRKPAHNIQVVIHPQSIVHSLVEFIDGSVKAQLGIPDMRIPIQFALGFPKRLAAGFPRLSFDQQLQLEFEPPDLEKFRCLRLAYAALDMAGTAPAVLNGADEAAVALFLQQKIRFDAIPILIEAALEHHQVISDPDVEAIMDADRWARNFVASFT